MFPKVGRRKFSGGNSIVQGQWKKKGLFQSKFNHIVKFPENVHYEVNHAKFLRWNAFGKQRFASAN